MAALLIFIFVCYLIFKLFGFLMLRKVEISHIDYSSYKDGTEVDKLPYIKQKYFMTYSELNFFHALENFNQGKYFIVPQVALSKLVKVDEMEKMKRTYHNKIDRKSVDFVLFDKQKFQPNLVIELDDRTHDRYDRKIRDEWVDSVLNKVGIKIIHIRDAYNFDATPIVAKLQS